MNIIIKMRYMIVEIGCLCCDTPSNVVGIVSSLEEANNYVQWIDAGRDMCTKYSCTFFPIPDNDFINEQGYNDLIEHGKKEIEIRNQKLKRFMASRSKKLK